MTDLEKTNWEIGQRIIWAREERELKQYWVAQEAGLEVGRYCRIEKGKVKRIFNDEMMGIARVLRCSQHWLSFGGKQDPWFPCEAPVPSVAPRKWQGGDAQQGDMQI